MAEVERPAAQDPEADSAPPLPDEVTSLLDLNADVDLAPDLAAPSDLAAARERRR